MSISGHWDFKIITIIVRSISFATQWLYSKSGSRISVTRYPCGKSYDNAGSMFAAIRPESRRCGGNYTARPALRFVPPFAPMS
jgi:hypothetical protein